MYVTLDTIGPPTAYAHYRVPRPQGPGASKDAFALSAGCRRRVGVGREHWQIETRLIGCDGGNRRFRCAVEKAGLGRLPRRHQATEGKGNLACAALQAH